MTRKIVAIVLSTLTLTGCVSSRYNTASKTSPAPNIILFLVDDMGWQDTSVPFANVITENNRYQQTPNMERLASEGMVFTNAYASSPVCSPTRTSILTGKNPARTHITNWIPGGNGDINEKLQSPDWRVEGLTSKDITLPKLLKEEGYTTAFIGKAHFGNRGAEGADPKNLGFDINICGNHRGQPGSYYPPYGRVGHHSQVPDLEDLVTDSLYLTDALTVKAEEVIEKLVLADDKPFFLMLSHFALHTPLQGDLNRIDQFRIKGKTETQATYASMVSGMDSSLGDIMDKLSDLEIDNNTIIIFMSDNGGLVTHGGNKRDGEFPTTCFPLRLGKGGSFEGGIRVPMIVKMPFKTNGDRCSTPVIADDFLPSIIEMANGELTKEVTSELDGESFVSLLGNSDSFKREKALVWHYPHYWATTALREKFPDIRPYSAVRVGNWKLIYPYDSQEAELYNLKTDIGEQQNVISSNREIAKELCSTLVARMVEMSAQTPLNRATKQPVPMPHL